MNDHVDRVAEVIEHVLSRHGEHGTYLDAARALDAAGLLAVPAPDTVTLRREDVEDLLYRWSEEPDYSDPGKAITARVRAALGRGDDSECDHDWEPHDLPDPSSAGAVLQRGHICRDCGKVED